jgi:hypothetical protein
LLGTETHVCKHVVEITRTTFHCPNLFCNFTISRKALPTPARLQGMYSPLWILLARIQISTGFLPIQTKTRYYCCPQWEEDDSMDVNVNLRCICTSLFGDILPVASLVLPSGTMVEPVLKTSYFLYRYFLFSEHQRTDIRLRGQNIEMLNTKSTLWKMPGSNLT